MEEKRTESVTLGVLAEANDRYLDQCLRYHKIYVDEVIVLTSEKGAQSIEIAKQHGARVLLEEEAGGIKNSFAAMRNYVAAECETEWILWADCDELFAPNFLANIRSVITEAEETGIIAYRFPRINLDNRHPVDYHVRLYRVKECEWRGTVHEKLYRKGGEREISQNEAGEVCRTLHHSPFIHVQRSPRDRLVTRHRWQVKERVEKGQARVMIASIIGKNQARWLIRFLTAIDSLNYPKDLITYAFIVGNNEDTTFELVEDFERRKQGDLEWSNRRKGRVFLKGFDMSDISRYLKLATLRDLLIMEALEDEEYVLMIDSDVVWLPRDLIQQLMQPGTEVTAPLVMIEDFRDFGNDYFYDRLAFISENGEHFEHFFPYTDGLSKGEAKEVQSVGTCYLVDTTVFRAGAKYITTEEESEQVSFCKRVRELGFRVAVNPQVRVLHVNMEKYGLEFRA